MVIHSNIKEAITIIVKILLTIATHLGPRSIITTNGNIKISIAILISIGNNLVIMVAPPDANAAIIEYINNKHITQAMFLPNLPNIALVIEIKLTSPGKDKETSNSNKALIVITNQTTPKAANVGKNPAAAVLTGTPIIPAPIQVPVTKNTPLK